MLLAKKFKTKLKLNVHKIDPNLCITESVLYWLEQQWTEFLEQQIIPKKQKRRA